MGCTIDGLLGLKKVNSNMIRLSRPGYWTSKNHKKAPKVFLHNVQGSLTRAFGPKIHHIIQSGQ